MAGGDIRVESPRVTRNIAFDPPPAISATAGRAAGPETLGVEPGSELIEVDEAHRPAPSPRGCGSRRRRYARRRPEELIVTNTAHAAILETSPGELVIGEVEVGDVGPREVLVRTTAAGLCHSDLHFIQGLYPYMLPMVSGHEAAGVVESVGDEVTDFRVGDHVVSCVSGFCGACRWCLTGRPYLCDEFGITRGFEGTPSLTRDGERVFPFFELGCFAELMLVPSTSS